MLFDPEAEREFMTLNAQLDAWEVAGWCNPTEQLLLYTLARNGPGSGAIVEIGSYQGRSTICLAAGSVRTGRERVTAIEPFEVCPYDGFVANVARAGLTGHVEPIIGLSHQAVRSWTAPIRLLYIDANHSYEAICQDYRDWSPFVVAGGLSLSTMRFSRPIPA